MTKLFCKEESKMRMKSLVFSSALLICALLFAGQARADAEIGDAAPAFVASTLDGKKFDLSALKGKVVLITFWVTWCTACQYELPSLEAVWRKYRTQGFEVLAVSVDPPRGRKHVNEVMKFFSFPAGMMHEITKNDLVTLKSVPLTYVIDKNGKVENILQPPASPLTEEGLGDEVKALLEAKQEAKIDDKPDAKIETKKGRKKMSENAPGLWRKDFPFPDADSHKYSRGSALIRGGAVMTGATRLAARAAQRMGAGLVTIAAPQSALPIYAKALESVIVRPSDTLQDWQTLIDNERHPALLVGPGLGIGDAQKTEVLAALAAKRPTVVDADGLTNFAAQPDALFKALHPECVLTPHEGEFAKLFGESKNDKISRATDAAERAGCILLLKGAETVIASPDGNVVVNRNAPPWLATAGAGDVLAGMILGLIAQKMPVFQAACAAAWIHGKIAATYGPGLIAEDIVEGIPAVLTEILKQ